MMKTMMHMTKSRLSVIGGLAVFVPTLLASAVAAQVETQLPYAYRGHMWGDGYGWFGMGGGFMVLFWILIIAVVVYAVRWTTNKNGSGSKSESALDILKERLARGDIEPAEYEERRKVLEK